MSSPALSTPDNQHLMFDDSDDDYVLSDGESFFLSFFLSFLSLHCVVENYDGPTRYVAQAPLRSLATKTYTLEELYCQIKRNIEEDWTFIANQVGFKALSDMYVRFAYY